MNVLNLIYSNFFETLTILVWVICGIISIKNKNSEPLGVAIFSSIVFIIFIHFRPH